MRFQARTSGAGAHQFHLPMSFMAAGTSKPRTMGHITGMAPEECPDAAITPSTLEYGTLPNPAVRRALRGEAWLAGHPNAPDALRKESAALCATPSTSMPMTGRAW